MGQTRMHGKRHSAGQHAQAAPRIALSGPPATFLGMIVFISCLSWLLAFSTVSQAATFELQVRANAEGGFNAPPRSAFDQAAPILDERGHVAASLLVVQGSARPGLWYGGQGHGGLVYRAPDEERVLTSLSFHSSGQIIFNQLVSSGTSDGIFRFDPATSVSEKILAAGGPFAIMSFSSVRLLDVQGSRLAFRANDWDGNRSLILQPLAGSPPPSGPHRLASEYAADPTSPFHYLFSPEMNESGRVVAKTLDGNGRDRLMEWLPDGRATEIPVVGREVGPGLPRIMGIDNSVALSSDGKLAFIGRLEGGARGVYLWDGSTLLEVAHTRSGGPLREIEYFAPAVNRNGRVAFRGKDAAGLQAIFVGNGNRLERVIGKHDPINSDLGPARIQKDNEHDPVFSGGVSLNDQDQLAFRATLTPAEDPQKEWGEGLYIAQLSPQ